MSQGPQDAAEGVGEGIKGAFKKAAGAVTGNEKLEAEGQAQTAKADAKGDAAKAEAQAEAARARAAAHEGEQKLNQ